MSKTAASLKDMRICALFEPGNTIAWDFLCRYTYPWEVLPHIIAAVKEIAETLNKDEYQCRNDNVWIHKTATIAPSAFIGSNVIIGAGTEVRHGAFIRGTAIIGNGAVVGNSTEIKNSLLFDKVQAPHYNYIGDSILGFKSHTGAGAITSNCKNDHSHVCLLCGTERVETGLKKFGAILADNVEVGCNAVLNPGTIIGARTHIYPLSMVRGFIPADSIYKKQGEIAERK